MLSPLRNRAGKRLREPFGKAGLTVAVIALVFAMLGGAYAASNNGGGKAVASKAKAGPRGPRGKTGPAGPAGPQGPAGANGKDGANGSNGSAGTNGKSVTVSATSCGGLGGALVKQEGAASGVEVCNGEEGGPGADGNSVVTNELLGEPGEECEGVGGTEFEVAGQGNPEVVCNGEKGEKGDAGPEGNIKSTLPTGVLETGSWSFYQQGGSRIVVTISLPIKLGGNVASEHIHFATDPDFSTFCGGSTGNPNPLNSSELCIYKIQLSETTFESVYGAGNGIGEPDASRSLSRTGGAMSFSAPTGLAQGMGTWAIKG